MKDSDSVTKILGKLDDLTREVKILRTDARGVKSDVTLIGMRLKTLENNDKIMQTDISDIKTDVRHLEVLHEDTDATIERIAEVVSPTLEQTTALQHTTDRHEDTLKTHTKLISQLAKKIA